jgi:hypothetical protein
MKLKLIDLASISTLFICLLDFFFRNYKELSYSVQQLTNTHEKDLRLFFFVGG